MIRVTANEYLDNRRREWIDAEMYGHVHFNKVTALVEIKPVEIQRAFADRGATA